MRTTSLLLVVMLVASCRSPAPPRGAEPDHPDVPDAGPVCSLDSEDPGCPPPTLSLARSPIAITPARDHHTTTVITRNGATHLYVLGGTDGGETIHRDIQRAPIAVDGSLGPFETIGELPLPLAGHATVVIDDTLVVSGGLTAVAGGNVLSRATYLASISDDGAIGPWREGPPLPRPLMHHTCDARERWLFCVGGRITMNFTATLAVSAVLAEDGVLSAYEAIAELPRSIGFHQAFVHAGALYVVGGLHRDPPMSDFDRLTGVLRAELHDDGTTGPWLEVGELPHGLHTGAAVVLGPRVYVLGGTGHGDATLDGVLAGTFDAEGSVVFEPIPARLSAPRAHVHHAPRHGSHLYFVGGRSELDRSVGIVDVGTFTLPRPLSGSVLPRRAPPPPG
jgi:hypothetical protein